MTRPSTRFAPALLALFATLLVGRLAVAELTPAVAPSIAPSTQPTTRPAAYPLTKCVISGDALDATAIVEHIDGREVRFCCADCVKTFKKDLEASEKKMDAQIIEAGKASYALKTCLVTDETMGEMGDPVMYVHRPTNQLVEFCCGGCVKKFAADPAKYLPKLAAATK